MYFYFFVAHPHLFWAYCGMIFDPKH